MVNLTRPALSLEDQLNKLAQLLVASYDNKLATVASSNVALHLRPHLQCGNFIELPSWKMEINFALYGISLGYPLALRGFHSWRLVTPCTRAACNYPRHSQLLF